MNVKRSKYLEENQVVIQEDNFIHNLITPELKELQKENEQLKQQVSSLKGNIKSIAYTSNNRHFELKRQIDRISKLQKKSEQLRQQNEEAVTFTKCYYNKSCKGLTNTMDEYIFLKKLLSILEKR